MRSRIKKTDAQQFLRFCVVGSLNAIIDFAILNALLWAYPTTSTEKILFYNSLAVLLASTNSFFCNKYWTFQQRQSITLSEVWRFAVVASATTAMNDALMLLLSKLFPDVMRSTLIGANAMKLAAIIGTMSISFFGMRLWVFFQKGRSGAKPADSTLLTTSLVTAAVHISDRLTVHVKAMSGMRTLIIIPTYNEIENLPLLLRDIFSYAPATNILIVDDNSPDGTGKLADEMAQKNPHIHVLHRPGKLGLGTAYIAGFKYAIAHKYDAAFEMDADFSHDPRYLPDFLNAIRNADLVIGSRYIPGGNTPNWSKTRRLISGFGNIFARFVLGIGVHDCTGGYRCYRRQLLETLNLDDIESRGYAFQIEMTYRVMQSGFKIVETPITFMDRRLGTSKMSRKIMIEAFTYVLRARFQKRHPFPESNVKSQITSSPTEWQSDLLALPVTPFDVSHMPSLPITPIPVEVASNTSTRAIRPVRLETLR